LPENKVFVTKKKARRKARATDLRYVSGNDIHPGISNEWIASGMTIRRASDKA
jgi:hypothetical protein